MMHDTVFLRHFDAFEPDGKSLRHVLLPEPLPTDASRISLHGHRPASQVRQHHRGDGLVVRGDLAFGDLVVWKEHLLRVRDQDGSRTTSRGCLSVRIPRSRGCLSLPWTVHSMNPTWTTISGRTQCPRRGRPLPFVNGGFSIDSASRCSLNS